MTSISKSHRLSELLYYNPSDKKYADLRKSLNEYQLLITALNEAISHYENGDLERFDCLVGENACQIRAIRLAFIATSKSIDVSTIRHSIIQIQETLNHLLSPSKINSLMLQGISFEEVLLTYKLDLSLSSDEQFLLKSFLLTEMKEVVFNDTYTPSLLRIEKSIPVNIKRYSPLVSYSFTNRLASKLRKLLSTSSVNFVREIASDLNDSTLKEMISEKFEFNHNSCPCIPMFWTYKTLLQEALNRNTPFVFHIKFIEKQDQGYKIHSEDYLFYRPTSNGSYSEFIPNDDDISKIACIIQGVACIEKGAYSKKKWKKTIEQHSIFDIVLAGAADHRQYPNADVKVHVDDCEFNEYKKKALQNGFSLDNPSTFFIQHVYTSKIGKKIKKEQPTISLKILSKKEKKSLNWKKSFSSQSLSFVSI
jgi:hypothetical protein